MQCKQDLWITDFLKDLAGLAAGHEILSCDCPPHPYRLSRVDSSYRFMKDAVWQVAVSDLSVETEAASSGREYESESRCTE